jgi:hypothetical protein
MHQYIQGPQLKGLCFTDSVGQREKIKYIMELENYAIKMIFFDNEFGVDWINL